MANLPYNSWWRSERWREYERVCGIEVDKCRIAVLNAATWQTRVVDLRPSLDALRAGLRKSYRQTIDSAAEFAVVRRLHGEDAISACRGLHRRVSGRVTRPVESWHLMAEWERTGNLVLVGAFDVADDDLLGFAAFERNGPWAYYGHEAASVRDVAHLMIWFAIRELKSIGVERLELGWQGQATDEKGKNIEFFRRGFGGVDVPATAGEGLE